MLMSGMLVVGAVLGTVLASESQADIGQTSEIAAEVPEGADTEEVCRGLKIVGKLAVNLRRKTVG